MILDRNGKIKGISQDEWKLKFRTHLLATLKEKNMSQSELARKSGLSGSRISDYINMKTVPTIFAAVNMADALDMKVEDLVGCDSLVYK